VYRYVAGTIDHGIVNEIWHDDKDHRKLVLYADSDHAGCRDTRKSTSGAILMVIGPKTRVVLGYLSKRQTVIATSSAEAETVAASVGMKKLLLPAREVRSELGIEIRSDSSAFLQALKKGYSRDLGHLSLMQGVHLGWLHELVYHKLRAAPVKVPTHENLADIFTKRLSNEELFRQLTRAMGVLPVHAYDAV